MSKPRRYSVRFIGLVLTLSLFLLSSFSLSGCSFNLFGTKPSYEESRAVLSVTNNYLRAIAMSDSTRAESYVLWEEFSAARYGRSRELMRDQLQEAKGRWTIENHPLLELTVVNLEIDSDDAVVVLQKEKDNEAVGPELFVRLRWVFSGWLIVDDSVIGTGGLLQTYGEETKAALSSN